MRITKQLKNDLEILALHSRIDIDYGVGGSFIDDMGEPDNESILATSRAIAYIKYLISKAEGK